MGTVYKQTVLYTFSSLPVTAVALVTAREGGWSESFWYPSPLSDIQMDYLATKRANLMASDCKAIGWRSTPYDFTGNKLTPKRGIVGSFFKSGKFAHKTNSPDDALRLQCNAIGALASWTMFLHAVPDDVVQSGAYVQNDDFVAALEQWFLVLQGRGGGLGRVPALPAVQWLGRDPTQVAQRVISVNLVAGQIVTQGNTNAVAMTDYIRLRRVYSDAGSPIRGSFFVRTAVGNPDGTWTYSVNGLPALTRTTPSGTARRDLIATSPLTTIDARLMASRKVGRPILLYRGRRAKIRL